MLKNTGSECEIASIKDELGVSGCGCLDTQAEEHNIRFPAAKQHDGFGANVGTEEGSGAAQSELAGGDIGGRDAHGRFVSTARVLKGIGDVGGLAGVGQLMVG